MIQAPLVDDAATRRRSSGARYESPLPLAGLVALTFFSVTGGPSGQELLVKAGGPLVALGSFALMTLLWSVPEALMTAELSSAFPEAAGFAAWSNAAYGPLVAWVDAWCSWVSGVVDNAVYPVLVLEYASRATDAFDDPVPRALFVVGFAAGLTYSATGPGPDGPLGRRADGLRAGALRRARRRRDPDAAAGAPLEVWLLSAGLLVAGLALYGAIGKTRRGNRLCAYHVLHADWAAPPGGLAARLGWADRLDDDPAALPEYDAAPPELSTGDEAASPLTS
ncbi:hypothetical protein JL721_11476 [Aureococcus anophagefferens]|nr:hypothetical protein JL721_11476 [Aureococcus anophagefferens]